MNEIDYVREICNSVLSLRKKHNIRTRMPLAAIKIVALPLNQGLMDIIKDEVNVKDVIFLDTQQIQLNKIIKINFKALGAKVGVKIKNITNSITIGEYKQQLNGDIIVEGLLLEKDQDFTTQIIIAEDGFNKEIEDYSILSNQTIVIVNIISDVELELEGICRDFVRLIQTIRKEHGFNIADKITILYNIDDEMVLNAIAVHSDYIKTQTLCNTILSNKTIKPQTIFNQCKIGIEVKITSEN